MANSQPRPFKGTTPRGFGQHPNPGQVPRLVGASRPPSNAAPGLGAAFKRLGKSSSTQPR